MESVELRITQRHLCLNWSANWDWAGTLRLDIVHPRFVRRLLRHGFVEGVLSRVMLPFNSRTLLLSKHSLKPADFSLMVGDEFVEVKSWWIQRQVHLGSPLLNEELEFTAPLDVANGKDDCGDSANNESPERPGAVSSLAAFSVFSVFLLEIGSFLIFDYNICEGRSLIVLLEHFLGLLHFLNRKCWVNRNRGAFRSSGHS